MTVWRLIFPTLWLLFASSVHSEVYLHQRANTVIGRVEHYRIKGTESLVEIARNFSIGFNALQRANPDLDAFLPGDGSQATLPLSWILPEKRTGLVVNLSELRLYYFFSDSDGAELVATFPIGIGAEGNSTPTGVFKVIEKIERPTWRVPPSIRGREPDIPAVVPSGPGNPLGTHALRLSLGDVLIHGTHRPFGVGRRVSHGCIRLYPEDIPILYSLVPKGAKVTILRQPVKVGVKNDRIYVEVHEDNEFSGNYFDECIALLRQHRFFKVVDFKKIRAALKAKAGFPIDVSTEG